MIKNDIHLKEKPFLPAFSCSISGVYLRINPSNLVLSKMNYTIGNSFYGLTQPGINNFFKLEAKRMEGVGEIAFSVTTYVETLNKKWDDDSRYQAWWFCSSYYEWMNSVLFIYSVFDSKPLNYVDDILVLFPNHLENPVLLIEDTPRLVNYSGGLTPKG